MLRGDEEPREILKGSLVFPGAVNASWMPEGGICVLVRELKVVLELVKFWPLDYIMRDLYRNSARVLWLNHRRKERLWKLPWKWLNLWNPLRRCPHTCNRWDFVEKLLGNAEVKAFSTIRTLAIMTTLYKLAEIFLHTFLQTARRSPKVVPRWWKLSIEAGSHF